MSSTFASSIGIREMRSIGRLVLIFWFLVKTLALVCLWAYITVSLADSVIKYLVIDRDSIGGPIALFLVAFLSLLIVGIVDAVLEFFRETIIKKVRRK